MVGPMSVNLNFMLVRVFAMPEYEDTVKIFIVCSESYRVLNVHFGDVILQEANPTNLKQRPTSLS